MADPAGKPQAFVQRLAEEGRVLFWGTLGTEVIFRKMADGEAQKKRMFDHLTRGLTDGIEAADQQTRDTREIFGIPDAVGWSWC